MRLVAVCSDSSLRTDIPTCLIRLVIEAADILHRTDERLAEIILVGQAVELLDRQKEMKGLRHRLRDHDFLGPDTRRHQPDRPGVRPRLFLPSRTDPRYRTVSRGKRDDDLDILLFDRDDPAS